MLLLFLALILLAPAEAFASWLIDPWKFHVSAHGQTSCRDCHEGIAEKKRHPDPSNVNKTLNDFFDPEGCLACHDEVMDNLDQGRHGSKQVRNASGYKDCLSCHNPHEQSLMAPDRPPYDINESPQGQCGVCHEKQSALPPLSAEDQKCMACHSRPDPDNPQMRNRIAKLCFHCHGARGTEARQFTGQMLPLIHEEEYAESTHAEMTCTRCHPRAPAYGHDRQELGDCLQCHVPHDEKVAHDAHFGVTCGACHLKGITPVRDIPSGRIVWREESDQKVPSRIHHMARTDGDARCRQCHYPGNPIGASAMVLPAKGILCMPCHSATLSLSDVPSIIAMIIFLSGWVMLFSWWLTGTVDGVTQGRPFLKFFILIGRIFKTVFSPKILLIIKAVILDVFLQRRLYRQSGARWCIHSLIFFPFVIRLLWGLTGLVGSLWAPEWTPNGILLHKDNPVTAALFDLTGVMILLGILLAGIRGAIKKAASPEGLPRQDTIALSLIAAIVIIGFFLEGIRIAMTDFPPQATCAFLGFAIGRWLSDFNGLTEIHGYVWYLHAILTGLFIAYLPFSRLLHIIMAPFVLAANAARKHAETRGNDERISITQKGV
ncbi:MAG: hypothetical protein JRJ85_01015 [Deltaproteobacteria bacterium]|nr:hypothetical protein [Deltaproteobacteria bacterium]